MAEERLAMLERGSGKKEPAEKNAALADGEPNPENFESYTDYAKALARWETRQELKEREQKAEQDRLAREQQESLKAHSERIKSFRKKTPDYDEVLEAADEEGIPCTPAMESIIVSSDHGPALLYELAKNPEEATRIAKLPPLAAAQALGRLEAKIAASTSEEKKPEPKKVTSAPKPIGALGGGKSTVAKSPEEMSFSEYERYRRDQLRRKEA